MSLRLQGIGEIRIWTGYLRILGVIVKLLDVTMVLQYVLSALLLKKSMYK